MKLSPALVALLFSFATYSYAALIDQTGNLIRNGDFESGEVARAHQ
jgi:hypothetical protein